MSIRLVFSQGQLLAPPLDKADGINASGVMECVFSKLIAEGILSKTQVILAIEDALVDLGETVGIDAERRMMALINTIALVPACSGET